MKQFCPHCSKMGLVSVTAETYYAVQGDYDRAQKSFDAVYERMKTDLDNANASVGRLEKQNSALQRRIEELEGELCAAASRNSFR